MLDFFCSFEGCSMSMSYRVWPSTIATRSSSACVALINIRFMVDSSRALTARNAGGPRPFSRPGAQARTGLASNYQRCLEPERYRSRERLIVYFVKGPVDAERLPVWHESNDSRRYPRAFPTG